jgi:hypothetical protein
MAAILFLFFDAKKLPKKPLSEPVASRGGLAARAGVDGIGLPVLGSTWTGLLWLCRSLTIAMA